MRSRLQSQIHISPLHRAPKGRICHHLSKKTRKFASVNEKVDKEESDVYYPMPDLPLLPDLAELACRCREANPGKQIAGATVDVSSAYQQFPQSVETAKLIATKILAAHPTIAQKEIELVVIYLVGTFGHKTAGNMFCQPGSAISEKHNLGRELLRSLTYIDDGILIDVADDIAGSVEEYLGSIRSLFGEEGVNNEKISLWKDKIEAIGWELNFRSWRAQPKKKGMAKLMVLLFDTIPFGAITISSETMNKLTGTLNWYAAGIPAGKAFTASLFACKAQGKSKTFSLTQEAQHDLMFWRALVYVAYRLPFVLGAQIQNIRRDAKASVFLRTDASSEIGGGAVMSLTLGGPPVAMKKEEIRWTREEIRVFIENNVSINVLEYFTVVFYVMLWSSSLAGKVVHVESDNTAAVSWLKKNRTKGRNPLSDSLAKLFTLFCIRKEISLLSTHLPGRLNDAADLRSRDLSRCPQASDEGIVQELLDEETRPGAEWRSCSKLVLCRSLLYLCVTKPTRMHGQSLQDLLMALVTARG